MSKRIAVVGGTGTIGSAIVDALREGGHQPIAIGHSSGEFQVDLADEATIRKLYEDLREVDAVVSAAGNAEFGALRDLDSEDFMVGFRNKLLGQINLVRHGLDRVAADGSFTLVSGILATNPVQGSAAISAANAAVEAFVRAASLEMEQRINCVSPGWVAETLEQMGRDPSHGTPAETVARAFLASVTGNSNGEVFTQPS